MAQYDIWLNQNIASSGIEFSEKLVNIRKGYILTGDASTAPYVLEVGTDGSVLSADSTATGGLKWISLGEGHTQNTDTGTTSNTFDIDSDNATGKIQLKVTTGGTNHTMILTNEQLSGARTLTLPNASGTIALTSQLPSSPMNYKGVIDCSINPNYPAATVGDTYIVSVAGKIGGASGVNVEIGDTLICKTTGSSGDHATVGANWNIVQKNIDGAVTSSETSVTDSHIAVFDGVTGKIIKSSGALLSSYVAKSLFDVHTILYATSDNTPAALTVGESTIVGRAAGGNIAALTAAGAMGILWQTAPAAKNSTGTAKTIAYDDNFVYICTATNTWKRAPLATNW